MIRKPDFIGKVWGEEEVIVNMHTREGGYCGKILTFEPQTQGSLHYHRMKTETFYVLEGAPILEMITPSGLRNAYTLAPGDVVDITAGMPHRVTNATDDPVKIIETSDPHDDDDVFRLDHSRRL